MDNSDVIAGVLKSLYYNAVNEFKNHSAGRLSDNELAIADKFINVIKDTTTNIASRPTGFNILSGVSYLLAGASFTVALFS